MDLRSRIRMRTNGKESLGSSEGRKTWILYALTMPKNMIQNVFYASYFRIDRRFACVDFVSGLCRFLAGLGHIWWRSFPRESWWIACLLRLSDGHTFVMGKERDRKRIFGIWGMAFMAAVRLGLITILIRGFGGMHEI